MHFCVLEYVYIFVKYFHWFWNKKIKYFHVIILHAKRVFFAINVIYVAA